MSVRRLGIGGSVLVLWVVLLGVVALPALAVALEAPELRVEAVTATTATLQGVLSPNVPGEVGTYEFLYNKGGSCKGAGKASGVVLGGQGEGISEALSGLVVNTEYTVCLVVENTEGETVESAPVSFKTALPPETPETLSPAQEITATTATFEGVLNPKNAGNPGSYEFLYRPSATECQEGAAAPVPAGVASGVKGEAVKTKATGLAPATQYTFCLLARNGAGEEALGGAVTFTTPAAPPRVESESASSVRAGEATLEGQINANNQKTTYVFEYATAEALLGTAGATVLPGLEPLAAVFGAQTASVATGGVLAQNTTYFYRVIAENLQSKTEGKPADGPVQSFKTALPPEAPKTESAGEVTPTTAKLHGVLNPTHPGDTGSYEFVYRESGTECQGEGETATAPGEAHGLSPEPVSEEVTGLFPGATYTVCLRVLNGASESALGNAVSFTTHAVAPTVGEDFVDEVTSGSATLHGEVNPGGAATTYRFEYGPTTSYGTTLSGDAGSGPETVPVSVHPQDLAPSALYHYRLVVGNEVDGEVTGPDHTFTTQAASTTFALPDGRAWEMISPPNKNGAEVSTIRVIKGGTLEASENGEAITYTTSLPISAAARSSPVEPQVISRRGPDGWASEDLSTPHNGASGEEYTAELKPRLSELGEYFAFSPDLSLAYVQPEAQTPLVPGQPAPEHNASNGSRPPGSGFGYESAYVRDMATGAYSITTLTPEAWVAEQVARVQGSPSCDASTSPAKGTGVDAISRDGCYVYFNSESILAPGASGTDPLYVSRYDGSKWTTTFISSLSGTGVPEWSGDYVELSPNGRYAAFMSELSLTGYDNRDAVTGEPDQEVYLYDAAVNRLVCASCNPTGARPAGQFDHGTFNSSLLLSGGELLVDRRNEWAGHRLAGILPDWSWEGEKHGGFRVRLYQPRYLSDSGRLFFDSPDRLVAQDVNGLENVYEYEPGSVGSCGGVGGCVSLISSGTSNRESAFVDASAGGDDAFFITGSRLTSQDVDGAYDMYDAHVCSASVPCSEPLVSPPACETSDSCKGPPPQSASFGAPASSTFSGAGNVASAVAMARAKAKPRAGSKKCRRGLRRNDHGRCVKQKAKTKAKKSSRRSK